ncbi:MAG: alpha/beta hydrolase-fold protein [Bryobacterales bacterium]|jgi:enterochelin esterase family protein|nr:alpha/beta hydrolase-fold protein [Bryobacterales bacterium]
MRFLRSSLLLAMLSVAALAAEPLIDIAKGQPGSRALREAIEAHLQENRLADGTAYASEGGDFVFAVRAAGQPVLYVDGLRRVELQRVDGSDLWATHQQLSQGTSHTFHYEVGGRRFGGRNDVPAYLPECYRSEGVPQGALSEKKLHRSTLYGGAVSEYWIYVPAQYRRDQPAALMVWQDGQNHIQRDGNARTLNVIDNLIHQGRMPVSIHVFIAPATLGERRMRSVQYDAVDDTYARFLRDELLPEVQAAYSIRRDSYSRAIAGVSSGGICAFNVAWQQPDQFSRVHSLIGSFTSIQWRPGELEGGNVYPFMIRKQPKRNLRVWLQDGLEDLENDHGSWPLQNLQMANSLKMRGYDYRLSWGTGTHNQAHGNAELPRSLTWLWREYSPAQTEQVYQQDAQEQQRPLWRVTGVNRD